MKDNFDLKKFLTENKVFEEFNPFMAEDARTDAEEEGYLDGEKDEKALLCGWGKQITLIYDGSNFFINLATLGRYDIKSPFHAISNYYFLKSLKRKLETDLLLVNNN
jgi:hypothetical protein